MQLHELRFELAPSAANFLFVQPPPADSAAAVADALRERQILVRHYDREPIAGWFRITIGTRDQHERLLRSLEGDTLTMTRHRLETRPGSW